MVKNPENGLVTVFLDNSQNNHDEHAYFQYGNYDAEINAGTDIRGKQVILDIGTVKKIRKSFFNECFTLFG